MLYHLACPVAQAVELVGRHARSFAPGAAGATLVRGRCRCVQNQLELGDRRLHQGLQQTTPIGTHDPSADKHGTARHSMATVRGIVAERRSLTAMSSHRRQPA